MFVVEPPWPSDLIRCRNSSEDWCSLVSSREIHGITRAFGLDSDVASRARAGVAWSCQGSFVEPPRPSGLNPMCPMGSFRVFGSAGLRGDFGSRLLQSFSKSLCLLLSSLLHFPRD
ncbi:hypothetical protein CRG98_045446 [Punica granatum]|uniref:Uncharacterized protein n=1 Tax=Punica granatum TaxID=22663 RepID=A0A2I0HR24_PUNGR|nr:hypothetical protein CRG98_045446 [Punica granatum]